MGNHSPHPLEIFSKTLRSEVINLESRSLLIAKIEGSVQEKDLTKKPNCQGFGRVKHFFRRRVNSKWVDDPLPIDPACKALGQPFPEMLEAQVFQLAACNLDCWYCFVPRDLLVGRTSSSAWFTAEEILDLYFAEKTRPLVLDFSGGHPDLAPEWVVWSMETLIRKGLQDRVYLWSDDNLTTDFSWTLLDKSSLSLLREYPNFGRVGCLKGFDQASFSFNTGGNANLFSIQFELLKKLIASGIDSYAYVTFTTETPEKAKLKMRKFVDDLQRIHENLPLRTVPLEIIPFEPLKQRMTPEFLVALKNQYRVLEVWKEEIETRFSREERSKKIFEVKIK